jgi:hypothetical protein
VYQHKIVNELPTKIISIVKSHPVFSNIHSVL